MLYKHWTGLAGNGRKLTRVSQAQIPPRPRGQLGVVGSGDPEAGPVGGELVETRGSCLLGLPYL